MVMASCNGPDIQKIALCFRFRVRGFHSLSSSFMNVEHSNEWNFFQKLIETTETALIYFYVQNQMVWFFILMAKDEIAAICQKFVSFVKSCPILLEIIGVLLKGQLAVAGLYVSFSGLT